MFRQPIDRLRGLFEASDLAIDLGTANTRIYALGRGIVAEESSIVEWTALNTESSGPALTGRNRDRAPVMPVRGGVVVDVPAAAALLRPMISRSQRFGLRGYRGIVCAPTDADRGERDALVEAAGQAGVSVLDIVPEPLAAALGGGLNIASPYAQMIVDIGSGVTDIAVIRSRRIVFAAAIRTACGDFHAAVTRAVAARHGVRLHAGEAERLVAAAGALRRHKPACVDAATGFGADGCETAVRVHDWELRESIDPFIDTIVAKISDVLRNLPEMTAVEVIEDGIWLTGGGACIDGMVERIAGGTTLDGRTVRDPLHAVIHGAALMLAGTVHNSRPQ